MLGHVAHIVSINQYHPLLYIVETCQQSSNGALPGPRWNNGSYRLASLNVQIEIVQHRQIMVIAECHIAKLHFATYLWELLSTGLVDNIGRYLQNLEDALCRYPCA